MRKLIVSVLRFYKLMVSPLVPSACRYYPSCSEYVRQAVEKYGVGLRSNWRITNLQLDPTKTSWTVTRDGRAWSDFEFALAGEYNVWNATAAAALAAVYRRVTDQVAVGSAVEAVLGMRQGTEAEIDGRADVTAQAALTWLANNGDQHFFLWVHFFDPH